MAKTSQARCRNWQGLIEFEWEKTERISRDILRWADDGGKMSDLRTQKDGSNLDTARTRENESGMFEVKEEEMEGPSPPLVVGRRERPAGLLEKAEPILPEAPSQPLTTEDGVSKNAKARIHIHFAAEQGWLVLDHWPAPPSGGDQYSPEEGCGWKVFVVP